MPSFSFTAPIITVEQEKKEWEELQESERESIRKDIFGEQQVPLICPKIQREDISPSQLITILNSTEDSTSLKIESFQDVLSNVPEKDKKDFFHALETVPELVALESNPSSYMHQSMDLEVCNADVTTVDSSYKSCPIRIF